MSLAEEAVTSPLIFSVAAASKVKELIEDEGNNALMLRVFVSGGGCGGMNYGMTFAETPDDRDSVLEDDRGCRLVVQQYCRG